MFRLYYTITSKIIYIYMQEFMTLKTFVRYPIQTTEISSFHRTSHPENTGNSMSKIHKFSPSTGNAVPSFHDIIPCSENESLETSTSTLQQPSQHVLLGNNEVLILDHQNCHGIGSRKKRRISGGGRCCRDPERRPREWRILRKTERGKWTRAHGSGGAEEEGCR